MELIVTEPENSLCLEFERLIPDDSMVINCKLNVDEDGDDVCWYDIKKYVKDLGCDILFSSAGLHLNGENKKPHIHYTFITTYINEPSNLSQHRKRWAKKNECDATFLNTSWKFHHKLDKGKPKYACLAYPLKEGNDIKGIFTKDIYIYDKDPMKKNIKEFLIEYGKTLYEASLALRHRQDKCEERKKIALNDLANLCRDNKDCFSNYMEMVRWLDKNYIDKLTLDEYPDPKNYKTNCQKIAVNLGKLKYSDII